MSLDDAVAEFATAVGTDGPVTISGAGTRGGPVAGVRCVTAPTGIEWVQPAEMTIRCGAGTPVAEVDAALAEFGQCVAVPDGGTIGGALAVGHSGHTSARDGARFATRCCRCGTSRRRVRS